MITENKKSHKRKWSSSAGSSLNVTRGKDTLRCSLHAAQRAVMQPVIQWKSNVPNEDRLREQQLAICQLRNEVRKRDIQLKSKDSQIIELTRALAVHMASKSAPQNMGNLHSEECRSLRASNNFYRQLYDELEGVMAQDADPHRFKSHIHLLLKETKDIRLRL